MADIQLYDATLRDGMGGGGLSLTAEEKLRVVRALDELGLHMIEAGFPASNPKELELFALLAAEAFAHAQIAAFGTTRRRDVAAQVAIGPQSRRRHESTNRAGHPWVKPGNDELWCRGSTPHGVPDCLPRSRLST